MAAYDRLPADLRAWLAQAALPWSPASALRIWRRAGSPAAAFARLDAAEQAALARDRAGVAVSPAMNHGGPFPATGHPGFTAVGIPASLHRFAMLQCYDNVRSPRLPALLQDKNPNPDAWRCIDGTWTQGDVPA